MAGTPLANREVELLSYCRMRICRDCKVDGKDCLNPSHKCCKCGCNMPAKTRVLNAKCPLAKW